ncbi:MAG: triose-phosphate isomerase [Gammaproteobacteria bacterium]
MRPRLVAGNWKMNGTRAEILPLVQALKEGLDPAPRAEVAVCPPFVYLPLVGELLERTPLALGAQDVCEEAAGAYTGEVSGLMLRDYRCRYVIVGHSERRHVYREDDGRVARKFSRALSSGLIPILCLGETLAEREAGNTEAVVDRQLGAVLEQSDARAMRAAVIAYEPVWAIGTGRNATPAQAQEVHAFIRGRIAEQDREIAASLRILYGGSVKGANAAVLFAMPDIDGGLIGGASLSAEEFLAICRVA